jgi:hypothetical protein
MSPDLDFLGSVLTITLLEPDFLARLALPFICAVPYTPFP